MRFSHPSTIASPFTGALAGIGMALLATLVPAGSLAAQLQPQAVYPLLNDLLDATNTYGPVMLTGTPPPSAPANGVCHNGIYFYSNGQDIRTPLIGSMDTNDFQIDLEFQIAALPNNMAPVLMGGNGWRWLGIYVQANGTVGLKYNNSNLTWSTTTLTTGVWYLGSVRFEAGTVELWINGHMVHTLAVGPLNTNNGANINLTTNDFSNGLAHNGCIRNLAVYNDTTLGRAASTQTYGHGCDGLTMTANGVPSLGNAGFSLDVSNVPAVSPLVLFGLGTGIVDPGADLTGIGMAGCFSFTDLNLGIFGPSVVVGGTASLALPIPNMPSLTGLVLYAQGLSMSTATVLGLASSNAMQIVVGI